MHIIKHVQEMLLMVHNVLNSVCHNVLLSAQHGGWKCDFLDSWIEVYVIGQLNNSASYQLTRWMTLYLIGQLKISVCATIHVDNKV